MSAENIFQLSKNRTETILPKSALVLNKTDYKRTVHSNNGAEKEQKVWLDNEYEEYLKNGSRKMVQKWDNTLEKVRQRKIAALKKKEEQKKAEGSKLTLNMVQNQ